MHKAQGPGKEAEEKRDPPPRTPPRRWKLIFCMEDKHPMRRLLPPTAGDRPRTHRRLLSAPKEEDM